MTTQHTPSPWNIMPSPSGNLWGVVTADKTVITRLDIDSHANAKLIAAAPELLAYAKKELNWLLHISGTVDNGSIQLGVEQGIKAAREIIAKAEGK